jgi:hypothetical protein
MRNRPSHSAGQSPEGNLAPNAAGTWTCSELSEFQASGRRSYHSAPELEGDAPQALLDIRHGLGRRLTSFRLFSCALLFDGLVGLLAHSWPRCIIRHTARPLDVEPEWFLPPSFYAGLTAAAGEVGEVLVQLKRRSHRERPQRLHRSGP